MRLLTKSVGVFILLTSLLPVGARAQEGSMKGQVSSATQPGFGTEELEDRRQEIVVANMKFSNDEQKGKFLEVYVPYQMKLSKTLKERRALRTKFEQEQQNGVISDPEAANLVNEALRLDRGVEEALSSYVHQLKGVVPEEQALRAYQLEKRLNALYYTDLLGSTPLVR